MVNIQQEIDAGRLNARIVSVISSRREIAGNDRARELGLEPHIIRKKDFNTLEAFSAAISKALLADRVDLVVQCGWLCLWQIPVETGRQGHEYPPRAAAGLWRTGHVGPSCA